MFSEFASWITQDKNIVYLIIAQLIGNSIRAFSQSLDKSVIKPTATKILGEGEFTTYNFAELISGTIVLFINLLIIYSFAKLTNKSKK